MTDEKRDIARLKSGGWYDPNCFATQTPNMPPGTAEETFYELLAAAPPTAPDTENLYALILANARKGQEAALNAWRDILTELRQVKEVEVVRDLESGLIVSCTVFGAGMKAAREIARRYVKQLIKTAQNFPINTSEEAVSLGAALSDGKTGKHWKTDTQALTRTHQNPGLYHSVEFRLTAEDKAAGLSVDDLEDRTDTLDADGIFALYYVSRLLTPAAPLPPGAYAGVWVDLDDVASKIWPAPRSAEERKRNRARVYNYLLAGARAYVDGDRSIPYFDKRTGKKIKTVIQTPRWSFMGRQSAQIETPTLRTPAEPPLRLELVASLEWTAISMDPSTAQYLPLGERLGAIPGNKPSGAWARVVGLALAYFWRSHLREALDGTLRPTRRELLTKFTPTTADPIDVLYGTDPFRALKYWKGALDILSDSERGLLAKEGEPSRKPAEVRDALPRYEWQNEWLDDRVDLRPGPAMRPFIEELAKSLPPLRPKVLSPKKRGRPRKRPV
jgi:hypothetical protein